MKIVWNSMLIALGVLGSIFAYMYALAHRKQVKQHGFSVNTDQLEQKQLTLFFISDIHRRKIDERLLNKIREFGPIDMVIIGGDLAEGGVPVARIEENVEKLSMLGELFFIWGNNDREVGEDVIRRILQRHGGTLLENSASGIASHPTWCLCGTDDPSSNNVDISRALQNSHRYKHLIVATHSPVLFRKVKEYVQPDLMLAGHTHGGQIRIGRFGLHPLGKFTVSNAKATLISNGYGTSIIPLRFGAKPECHIIRIRY